MCPLGPEDGCDEQSHRRCCNGYVTTAVKEEYPRKQATGYKTTHNKRLREVSLAPEDRTHPRSTKGERSGLRHRCRPSTPRTSCRPGFGRRALSAVSCPREHELTFPASFFLITQPSYITPKRWSTPEPSRLLTSSFHFHRSCLVCIHSLRERLVLVYYTPGRHSLSWHSSLSLRACGVLTFLSYPVSLTLSTILRDG